MVRSSALNQHNEPTQRIQNMADPVTTGLQYCHLGHCATYMQSKAFEIIGLSPRYNSTCKKQCEVNFCKPSTLSA